MTNKEIIEELRNRLQDSDSIILENKRGKAFNYTDWEKELFKNSITIMKGIQAILTNIENSKPIYEYQEIKKKNN